MPHIRSATVNDATRLADLLSQLGYPSTAAFVAQKLALLAANPMDAVFVAEDQGRIAGMMSLHVIELFHTEGRLGRITSLVVDETRRGLGVGKLLVQAANEHFIAHGCRRAEVTSGARRIAAHAFYQALGYALDGKRFVKPMRPDPSPNDPDPGANASFG